MVWISPASNCICIWNVEHEVLLCLNWLAEFAVTVSFHLEPDTQEGKRSWCWVRLFHDVKKRLTATPFHAHVQQCLHKDEKLIWRTRLQQSRRRERNDTRSVRPLCLHSYTHFYSLVYFGLLKVQMQETLTYVDCHVLPLELPEFRYNFDVCALHDPPCYLNSHFLSFSRGLQTLKFLLLPTPRRQFGFSYLSELIKEIPQYPEAFPPWFYNQYIQTFLQQNNQMPLRDMFIEAERHTGNLGPSVLVTQKHECSPSLDS
ncbi:uncharacterized protein [Alexandromys fortis]|uniref:uncharacterized protein isoform X1 n=1 Tax=Alexandromys fortis TaxID=100897 RepID=UPI002152AD32|nr:uncharacterized protein LOC126487762 isoform X1 [Microtus fortis]